MDYLCKEQLTNPNTTLYDDELWEAGKGYCTYLRTGQAVLLTALSSSVSAIASLLLVYLILISPTKLSSIYHRIMFGIGISDIIFSVANAFTTLPMPAPGHDFWTDMVNIQGARMGNIHTCTAQGFLITFGSILEPGYYFGLCAYYVFAIGFKMKNECMLKYVEPVIHVAVIVYATFCSLPPIFDGGYNVYFGLPTCTLVPKPWFCDNGIGDGEGSVECIGGAKEVSDMKPDSFHYYLFIGIHASGVCIQFFPLAIVCLALVCWRVFYKERQIRSYLQPLLINGNQEDIQFREGRIYGSIGGQSSVPGTVRIAAGTSTCILELLNAEIDEKIPIQELIDAYDHQYANTKAVTFQSMLYLSSVGVTGISWQFLLNTQTSLFSWYNSMLLILSSVQGVQNLCIFLFHKVYNLKRSNSNVSTWKAITRIFKNGGIHDSFVLSRMDLVLSNIAAEPSSSVYDDYGSIVGDSENDVSQIEEIRERSNVTTLPFTFETSIKRYANSGNVQNPSSLLLSKSECKSYGGSANYGGSLSERSVDSAGFFSNGSHSIENAS